MVYGTYNYSFHAVYKPTYNWGAPHCGKSSGECHQPWGLLQVPTRTRSPGPRACPRLQRGKRILHVTRRLRVSRTSFIIPSQDVVRWGKSTSEIMDFPMEICQWIGLRENLQENTIFNGKIYGFL